MGQEEKCEGVSEIDYLGELATAKNAFRGVYDPDPGWLGDPDLHGRSPIIIIRGTSTTQHQVRPRLRCCGQGLRPETCDLAIWGGHKGE